MKRWTFKVNILALLLFLFFFFPENVQASEPPKQQELVNEQIDKLITRMREISFNLMPTSLTRKGFATALNQFIEYCSKSSVLKISPASAGLFYCNALLTVNGQRIFGGAIIYCNSNITVTFPEPTAAASPLTSSIFPILV